MDELTIGEVARRAGVRTTAIRYYESISVLPPPARASGRRRYDASVVERLTFIQAAQRLGFSLGEIALLLDQRAGTAPLGERWQSLARAKLADVERTIEQAQRVRQQLIDGLRCGCADIDSCIGCVREVCVSC